MKSEWVVGIDEVGRGPLAGPVGVGVVLVRKNFNWDLFSGVGDSKKVKLENREAIFQQAKKLKISQEIFFSVSLVSAKIIDEKGIVPAINQALLKSLLKVIEILTEAEKNSLEIKLDGGLRAPVCFCNQKTIIKGDEKEKVIGLASILAKVTRDKYMIDKAEILDFAVYDFKKHKGYGTKFHREMIKKHGLSKEHRKSFCRNIILANEEEKN